MPIHGKEGSGVRVPASASSRIRIAKRFLGLRASSPELDVRRKRPSEAPQNAPKTPLRLVFQTTNVVYRPTYCADSAWHALNSRESVAAEARTIRTYT